MSSRRRSTVPPQVEILPGMPPSPMAEVTIEAANAIARALMPQYVGIRPEDYADITPDLVALADPSKFRASLIDIPLNSEGGLSYRSFEPRRTITVGATASEFTLLSGSLQTLGGRAVRRTEASRRRAGTLSDADRQASQRSGVHAVESRVDAMQRYLDLELEPEVALVQAVRKALKYPGFAHQLGDEGEVRQKITTVRTQVFGKLFEALGIQRQWTSAQQRLAERSLDRRLHIDRFGNKHLGDFDRMLALAEDRSGHLRAVTHSRMSQAHQYINTKRVNA